MRRFIGHSRPRHLEELELIFREDSESNKTFESFASFLLQWWLQNIS